MAETHLVNGVTEIMNDLISKVVQEIARGGWGVKDDLNKLKTILESIPDDASDAETRQNEDGGVRIWLKRLKSVAFDAEDVLDEFSYEVVRRSEMDNLLLKVMDFFSSSNHLVFRAKMAHRVKNLIAMFADFAGFKSRFGTSRTSPLSSGRFTRMSRRPPSFAGDSDEIVGRENDKSKIIDLLFKSSGSSNNYGEKISVVPIVGMGGLGKTALAQSVYNDESIKKDFKPRIWVCVSADFDVSEILKDIKESIDNNSRYNCDELDVDERGSHVREMLKGKKYLLVLDDLWNEDADKWEKLKSYLMYGSEGSKIIVTTRKIHVAWNVQGIIPTYHLQQLSTDDCWSIIKKRAFSPGGAVEIPAMVELGKEIATKCSGLPLVATMLGQVNRPTESDWASIRDTDLGSPEFPELGNIIEPLKLSYDHLPSSALKQCFSYCSLFPRGWEMDREAIIQLWTAEGFLQPPPSSTEISMEDIGNEYFNTLLSHSLFQYAERVGDIQRYKMNDFVHHLARTVAGNEYSILKAEEAIYNSEVRRLHLVFAEHAPETFPLAGNCVNKLRTIFAIEVGNCDKIERVFANRNLRVLYISGSSIQKVPASISRLKYLRYLNLSGCHDLEELHDQSVNCLYNLQTLILHNCSSLSKLPEDIGSMKTLRHLNLSYTRIGVLPDSVTRLRKLLTLDVSYCKKLAELPTEIGCLKDLKILDVSHSAVFRLPDSIISLHKLARLRLHSCHNLMVLPSGIETLRCSIGLDNSGTSIKVPESLE